MDIDRASTEYLYAAVTGDVPSAGAEVAYVAAGVHPQETEWASAIVVTDADPLFTDASATGLAGDYFVARLVGSFGGNTLVLTPGDYQAWLRLTDVDEQPVRILPNAVTVL